MKGPKYRRQKPVRGGRLQLPSCVIPEIRQKVADEAIRWNVSKSFIIAVALAEVFGINKQEKY